MAYVDGFEHDIFLSYARKDDEAAGGETGWVTAFEERLRIFLQRKVGDVEIWRDQRQIAGNQRFDDTIRSALDTSAVFVALNSCRYVASDYCKQELAHFRRIGPAVDDRERIFNVLLTNIKPGRWLAGFGGTSGFDFHDARPEDKEEDGEPSEPGSSELKRQLKALGLALRDLLRTMKERARPAVEPEERAKGTVFLAVAAESKPLESQRRKLTEDLEGRGIEIVSGVPPTHHPAEHDRRVITVLRGADLSVHLFDAVAGREIDGREGVTYPQRQAQLAGEHARSRIIWLPQNLELSAIQDPSHGAFLRGLERGEAGSGAFDFIRGVPADLSGAVLDKVEQLLAGPKTDPGKGNAASCLLVTHEKDTEYLLPVYSALKKKGVRSYINQEADDPEAELKLFEDRLKLVASLIVFYGEVSRAWVRERIVKAGHNALVQQRPLKLAVFATTPERSSERIDVDPLKVELLSNKEQALEFVR
jgi:hypothetical protein